MTGSVETSVRANRTIEIFAATCSGTADLSVAIDLPVVHVDAAVDAEAAVRRLNEREHGSAGRVPDLFQPLVVERGWGDWTRFEIEPGLGAAGLAPAGLTIERGRIVAELPAAMTDAEFRVQLAASLRHLRLQEATIQASYLERRSDQCSNYTIHPRYTLRTPRADFRRATLCEDLYVIDPAEFGWRLVWIVVAARLAAGTAGRPLWR